jgi:hypothetical protein
MAICRSKVTRETESQVRELGKARNTIVTVLPSGAIGLRLKGLRSIEWLDAGGMWQFAVRKRKEQERAAKRREKKNGK